MELGELKSEMMKLPQIVGGHPFWMNVRSQIRQWVLTAGPDARLLPDEHHLLVQTMKVSDRAPYIAQEQRALEASPRWKKYRDAISWYNNIVAPNPPDGNSLHHMYHIMQWEGFHGHKIEDLDTIVEFGGGFGQTCSIARRMGFKGDYYIYDFPEFALYQKWYLSNWCGQACNNSHGEEENVYWNPADCPSCDLFIAEWSLSEAPDHERKPFLSVDAKSFLMAYSYEFLGQQNHKFFEDFTKDREHFQWHNYPIAHLDNRHAYLIGFDPCSLPSESSQTDSNAHELQKS